MMKPVFLDLALSDSVSRSASSQGLSGGDIAVACIGVAIVVCAVVIAVLLQRRGKKHDGDWPDETEGSK